MSGGKLAVDALRPGEADSAVATTTAVTKAKAFGSEPVIAVYLATEDQALLLAPNGLAQENLRTSVTAVKRNL